MEYQIELTTDAENDLKDIVHYIKKDSIENSISFRKSLENRMFNMISVFPYAGTEFKEIDNLRFFNFGNYICVYEINNEEKNSIYSYDFRGSPPMARNYKS